MHKSVTKETVCYVYADCAHRPATVLFSLQMWVTALVVVLQVLGDLQHTLLLKLDEARQQLATTPAGQAEQLGVQLQLVQQLLQTLAAVPQ